MAEGGRYVMRDGKRVLVHRTKEPPETQPAAKQQPPVKAAKPEPVKDTQHG